MSEIKDPYEDQLAAARYRAERDQARQECERLRARLRDSVPREAYERKRAAWLRHIEVCESALGRRNARIRELENASLERGTVRVEDSEAAEWVRKKGGLSAVKNLHDNGELPLCDLCEILGLDRVNTSWMDAFRELEKRLMPEGMEWPRFEDGEFVRTGDEIETVGGGVHRVGSVQFMAMTFCLEDVAGETLYQTLHHGRVKRPAPKVLDADGVEIRRGDTVWGLQSSRACVVDGFVTDGSHGEYTVDAHYVIGLEQAYLMPSYLTHRAPVPAADGGPLREGETVWSVDSGTRYTVEKITDGIIPIKCRSEMGSTVSLHPSQLTHERPVSDSWERMEEDAETLRQTIASELGDYDFDDTGKDSIQTRLIDLVRRAKKLAERDA